MKQHSYTKKEVANIIDDIMFETGADVCGLSLKLFDTTNIHTLSGFLDNVSAIEPDVFQKFSMRVTNYDFSRHGWELTKYDYNTSVFVINKL